MVLLQCSREAGVYGTSYSEAEPHDEGDETRRALTLAGALSTANRQPLRRDPFEGASATIGR